MTEDRFTDGNLIILYAIHNGSSSIIPEHIIERIKHCVQLYKIIVSSKPDGNRTIILVVSNSMYSDNIKKILTDNDIAENVIATDTESTSVSQTIDNIKESIKNRSNPPYIYFIGSVWLKDVFDSIVITKLKGYKVRFEGALDHRPVLEVEQEKLIEVPKKGKEYLKQTLKNKALDMLLNYIFPEDKKL